MLHRTRTLFLSAALMVAASFTAYASPPNEPADTPYAVAVTDSPAVYFAQVAPAPDALADTVYDGRTLALMPCDGTGNHDCPCAGEGCIEPPALASSTGSGRTSSGGALIAANVHARS